MGAAIPTPALLALTCGSGFWPEVSVRTTRAQAVSSGTERHLCGRSTGPARWTRARLEEHTEIVLVGKEDFGEPHLLRPHLLRLAA